MTTQLRVRGLGVGRKEEWKYGHKSCPCCKKIAEDEQEEDEYHAFCGECPRTSKLYEKFINDLENILSDCGVREGLDGITCDMSDHDKSRNIFLMLLADRAGKFPDRRGSWARAKARFEEHVLDCWQARASMIEDEESYIGALQEMLIDYEGDDSKQELQEKIQEVIDDKEIIKEEMENRKKHDEETRRNAKKNTQKRKKTPKSKKKKTEIDYTLRVVRHRETKDMGYIEKKSGKHWLVKWAPYKVPAVEHEIDEIHIEKDELDELPDLELIGKKFHIEAEVCNIENGVKGQVTSFEVQSGEFNVRFSEEVGPFWRAQCSFTKLNWHIDSKLIRKFLERAQARGKPGTLVHPDKG